MSKVTGVDDYVYKSAGELEALSVSILSAIGCDEETARFVAFHLIDADIKGVDSHGVMRLIQYVEQAKEGYFQPRGRPKLKANDQGAWLVDGEGGFGMPAISLAVDTAVIQAKTQGISAVGVMNCGHPVDLGLFANKEQTHHASSSYSAVAVAESGNKLLRMAAQKRCCQPIRMRLASPVVIKDL